MAPASPPPADALPAGATARFGTHSLLALLALTLVAVPFGLLLLLVKREWSPLAEVDRRSLEALHEYAVAHDGFVTAMRLVSDIGSFPVYLAVFAVVVGWLLAKRRPRLAVFVVVSTGGSSLLNASVKELVGRARPVFDDPVLTATSLSFPSGHAQSSIVSFSVLLLVFQPFLHGVRRVLAVALSVLSVLGIGFSRVALGVHYASDVIAGYVLGAAWLAAMIAIFSVWRIEAARPVARA